MSDRREWGTRETRDAPRCKGPLFPASFKRDEDGSILIFGLFILVAMLMMGGIAIDVMHAENRRAHLQNSIDRAVLAATDLDQSIDAKTVVADYLEKSGLGELGIVPEVEETGAFPIVTSRRVAISTSRDTPTHFMSFLGIDNLTALAATEAQETLNNVEISLILDISGSMRFSGKIGNLRKAAKDFVTTVIEADTSGKTSLSIVPYAGQVNPGPEMFSYLGIDRDHANSSCIELEAQDFNNGKLPHSNRDQVPHFMYWEIDAATMDWGWCPGDATSIVYAQNDAKVLTTFIDNMRLHDGTGTMTGMKWGVALLDPDAQPAFEHLSGLNKVPEDFETRPAAWDDTETKKFIILVTDGQITDQFRPKYTGFRDPDNDSTDNEAGDVDDVDGIDHDKWNAEVELDNGQPSGNRMTLSSRSSNLTRFYSVCDYAKANNVTVFTIAFEAPSEARTEMRNCASTFNHYYNVSGLKIGHAFASIATQINQLKLTQ